MTPAGTSNELDVQNEREENTLCENSIKSINHSIVLCVILFLSLLSFLFLFSFFRWSFLCRCSSDVSLSSTPRIGLITRILLSMNDVRSVDVSTFSPSGWCLKKNQNAPRPSEQPPVRAKKCKNVCSSTLSPWAVFGTSAYLCDNLINQSITQSRTCTERERERHHKYPNIFYISLSIFSINSTSIALLLLRRATCDRLLSFRSDGAGYLRLFL